MISAEYIIKCSITPPGVVYIGEMVNIDNEFTIEFEKVPIRFKDSGLKNSLQETPRKQPKNARPRISIRLKLGEGLNDLCTTQQASNLTFTTIDGEGWTMSWSSRDECFFVYPPSDFEFPESYRASFRSNEFKTTAQEGTTTLIAYIENFDDVETKNVAVNLYKRYPVDINYFESTSNQVEIGKRVVLKWKVLNAKKCYITGIGQVDSTGFKGIEIKKPIIFELSAEDEMGITERAYVEIRCKKPTIEISSESQFYHKGDSITLHWKSTLATSVQITPDIGLVDASGEKKLKIFTPKSITYTAIANGYDGSTPYVAMTSLYLEETNWRKIGQVEGLDLKEDLSNVDRRVWEYNGSFYLFTNMSLYKSDNLLTWEIVSITKPSPDTKALSGLYSTTVTDRSFIAMGMGGCLNERKSLIAIEYDFYMKVWSDSMSTSGINSYTDGIVTTLYGNQICYGYYHRDWGKFEIYRESSIWDNITSHDYHIFDVNPSNNYDIASSRHILYRAVGMIDGSIRVSQLKGSEIDTNFLWWHPIGTISKKVEGWIAMISTKSMMYLLTKDYMVNLDDFRLVSTFHPPLDESYRPWTGSRNNNPFLITKEGDLWSYEV